MLQIKKKLSNEEDIFKCKNTFTNEEDICSWQSSYDEDILNVNIYIHITYLGIYRQIFKHIAAL